MGRHTPHVSGVVAYCNCPGCERVRQIDRDSYHRRKVRSVDPRIIAYREKLLRAEVMLGDGASYAEVARTLSMCPKRLARKLPGYKGNKEAVNSAMSHIRDNQALLELHREIWQGGQYNKS